MTPVHKVLKDGTEVWELNGKLHREDGPAVIRPDGYQAWYLNGKRHRVGGPAITNYVGTQAWFMNDNYHRVDGPAVIYHDGRLEYYAFGIKYESLEDLQVSLVILA